MAQPLSNYARVHSCFKQKRRSRVPQAVELDAREAGGLRADHQLAPDVAVPAGVPLHHFTQSRFIGACSFNGDDTARVNAPRVGPRCVEGVFDTHDGSLAHWNALRREPHHVQPTILLCVAGS